jgi:hypothetical protein
MSIFVYSYHAITFNASRSWRKRPEEAHPPAKLQNERYVFTRRNLDWQEMIFRRNTGNFPPGSTKNPARNRSRRGGEFE